MLLTLHSSGALGVSGRLSSIGTKAEPLLHFQGLYGGQFSCRKHGCGLGVVVLHILVVPVPHEPAEIGEIVILLGHCQVF